MILLATVTGCATAPKPTYTEHKIHGAKPFRTAPYIPAVKGLFVWPVNGYVANQYGAKVDRVINKGIDIKSASGTPVRAAKSGRVVYRDPYLKGYGKTVIIDHGNGYQTVYSYNSDILVKVGDVVDQNFVIARVGTTGRAGEPMLHFEIRRDGQPLDPESYLPSKI